MKTIGYYIYFFKNLFVLVFIDFFTNRNKFKEFSASVNDFRTNYELINKSRFLKTLELSEIIGAKKENSKIAIENWEYRQGNVSLYELYCLCHLVKSFKPSSIFEIGTFDGRTTLHFAANTDDNTIIHTLDLPADNIDDVDMKLDAGDTQLIEKKGFRIGECFLDKPEASKIKQQLGDSAKFDYSPFLNKIDIFFIDGAHSYEYVKSDTINAFNTIKANGIIIWHDYTNVIDVTEYINELSKTKPIFRINNTSFAIYSPVISPN